MKPIKSLIIDNKENHFFNYNFAYEHVFVKLIFYQKVLINVSINYNEAIIFQNLKSNQSFIQIVIDQFINYFQTGKAHFNFPYCFLKQTEFAKKVLKTLKKTKFGSTISYQELAIKSNHAKAYQAVGSVCKKNSLPIIYPCHRVIKADGTLGNFNSGLQLKKYLLNLEKKFKN